MVQRLEPPFWRATGNAAERAAFFAEQSALLDQRARTRIAQRATESVTVEALDFFATDAGRAFMVAELFALAAYPNQPADFPQQAATKFGDTTAVGSTAAARIEQVRVLVAEGQSASPPRLSLEVAAARISPDQAQDIADFFASDEGQQWLKIQSAVFPKVQSSFRSLLEKAIERRFVESPIEPELPSFLPPSDTEPDPDKD